VKLCRLVIPDGIPVMFRVTAAGVASVLTRTTVTVPAAVLLYAEARRSG
jgi:hypothetical protein